MNENENSKARAQKALDAGGILTEKNGDEVRISIAIDANNPTAIFDKLNDFEIELTMAAGGNLEKIERVSQFVDQIRENIEKQLEQLRQLSSVDQIELKLSS